MRALAVEDDDRIAGDVAAALEGAGFRVERADDGETAWFLGDTEDFDLVVLDLGLPRMDGLSVLKRWRASGRIMPVLVLTARGSWQERVEGIEAGADDYLPKPFDPRELLLRLNNILRRGGQPQAPKVEQVVFGPYAFQIARRELKKAGQVIKLTDREQEILVIFAERAGETIPRHELVGSDSEVGERTIDVQINRLRRKIERDPPTRSGSRPCAVLDTG